MKTVYLVAAVAGAVVPYIFFVEHFSGAGMGFGTFLGAVFANPAASGFAADLLISSFVFWAFMFRERAHGGPRPAIFVGLNLLVGLSCALPAYLFARERR